MMHFSIDTIPFGIISTVQDKNRYIATAYQNYAINLHTLHLHDPLYDEEESPAIQQTETKQSSIFQGESLNSFISLGKPFTERVRLEIRKRIVNKTIPDNAKISLDNVIMHMPVKVGDYTDFYASKEHASNLGRIFRPNSDPLLPNWSHIPIGYHGRSSSIVVSGTQIHHPSGMILLPGYDTPVYQKSQKLDYELELGFIVGKDSRLGNPIPIDQAEDYLFGIVILNDWSARDIQKYEYVPLGPFLGKNFATTISAWVVPMEAFSSYRTKQVVQDPTPQPHLTPLHDSLDAFDIHLSVDIRRLGERINLCKTNAKGLYWSISQMITHHTSNGCNLRIGDILATGTISGSDSRSTGSMLELTQGKSDKLLLPGDEVIMYGGCGEGKEMEVVLGHCQGVIM